MTKHCKIYFNHFGYGIDDVVLCEICGQKANDIHHIRGRGKGMDKVENLCALCRKHHNDAHGTNKTYIHPDVVQAIHNEYLKNHANKNL